MKVLTFGKVWVGGRLIGLNLCACEEVLKERNGRSGLNLCMAIRSPKFETESTRTKKIVS